jgi:hypothetical protein
MARPRLTLSGAALVLANLTPLAGVAWLGWDAAVIVLLYWTENIILGTFIVLKMVLLPAEQPLHHLAKLLAVPFFGVHFGGFCAVHGLFLMLFLRLGGGGEPLFPGASWPGPLVFLQLLVSVIAGLWRDHPAGMEWPVLALTLSHGISFVQNFLLGGEIRRQKMQELMSQPYKRIALLHVAILAGAVPVMILGSPVPLLIILVMAKIVLDIRLHLKTHENITAAAQKGEQRCPSP